MSGAAAQRRHPGRSALLAVVAAALIGVVGILVWGAKSADTALNDTRLARPGPSQELLWGSQALFVLGVGGVVALLVGRRSRRAMWVLLGATGVLAIAIPWVRTDWSLRHDKQQMDSIAAPPGWRLVSYSTAPLHDRDGHFVGRTLRKGYLPSSNVTRASILAHYRAQLPGWTCTAEADGTISCMNGSRRLYTGDGGIVLVLCVSDQVPRSGPFWCGASSEGIGQKFQ